jgi:uncharacterized MAPEG superfamily protein
MTTELTYLTLATTFTGLLWMPYILNRLAVGNGLLHEIGYPDQATRMSPWAERLKRAHDNAVENLVVFAPLVLIAHVADVRTPETALAAATYLAARIAHAAAYTLAIPWVRTVAFSTGWACQMVFAWALLTR